MNQEVVIIVAEDDEGHASLIKRNLKRAGIHNRMVSFTDGQAVLDFLLREGEGSHREEGVAYMLLLDIRMPKIDGIEVLKRIKKDPEVRKMPVVMITTTDDPRDIARCHALGCSSYITKPVEYDNFIATIRQLGLYLLVVEVPHINGREG
jgi:CheY-like chemotaxis protein